MQSYDEFLGQFVDAVQVGDADFADLRGEWTQGCPAEWRDRFRNDVEEIESLVRAGAFGCSDAAA